MTSLEKLAIDRFIYGNGGVRFKFVSWDQN